MEVGRVAPMRRFRATSSEHKLITDTSLLCVQRNCLEPIVFRRQVRVQVLARHSSTERPLPADVWTAHWQPRELRVGSAAHAGCMCAASTGSSWITAGCRPESQDAVRPGERARRGGGIDEGFTQPSRPERSWRRGEPLLLTFHWEATESSKVRKLRDFRLKCRDAR